MIHNFAEGTSWKAADGKTMSESTIKVDFRKMVLRTGAGWISLVSCEVAGFSISRVHYSGSATSWAYRSRTVINF
jgi:hypothetical protein